MKKTLSLVVLAGAVMAFGFVGCNKSSSNTTSAAAAAASEEASVEGADAGFEEFDVGDEQEVGFLNVAGVYFQPVDMEGNGAIYNHSDYGFHIEADISALENDLGYGVGDFVPYLTVDYEILGKSDDSNTKNVKELGTFMLMNASDGPHYGANIKSIPAGNYTVTFKIHSPEENGFLLHTDALTGVKGRFSDYWKTKTLDVSWDWTYLGPQW